MSEVSYSNVPPMMAAIKSGDIEAIRSLLHAGHETEWGLHFEICTLPVGEPFGLMVEFSGDTPTDVYGLSEADEIEE